MSSKMDAHTGCTIHVTNNKNSNCVGGTTNVRFNWTLKPLHSSYIGDPAFDRLPPNDVTPDAPNPLCRRCHTSCCSTAPNGYSHTFLLVHWKGSHCLVARHTTITILGSNDLPIHTRMCKWMRRGLWPSCHITNEVTPSHHWLRIPSIYRGINFSFLFYCGSHLNHWLQLFAIVSLDDCNFMYKKNAFHWCLRCPKMKCKGFPLP